MAKSNKTAKDSLKDKAPTENMFNQFEYNMIQKYLFLKRNASKKNIIATNDSCIHSEKNRAKRDYVPKLKVNGHLRYFKSLPKDTNALESLKLPNNLEQTESIAILLSLRDSKNRPFGLEAFGLHKIITIYVGNSVVKHAYSERFKRQVAIKTITRFKQHSKERSAGYQHLKNELKIISALHHKNVMKIFNYIVSEFEIHVVMEYCQNGTLGDLMLNISFIPESLARRMFKGLSKGVQFCHHRRIFHRNITCDNIYISDHMRLKLGNFPQIKQCSNGIKETHESYMYTAPEVRKHQLTSGILADMWSMGTVLYVMLVGKFPYSVKGYNLLAGDETAYTIKPPRDTITTTVQSLIGSLLCPPFRRFVSEQVLAHKWFTTASGFCSRCCTGPNLKIVDNDANVDTGYKETQLMAGRIKSNIGTSTSHLSS